MSAVIAILDSTTNTGVMAADSGMSCAVNTRSRLKIRRIGSTLVASSGALAGGQFIEEQHDALLQGGFAQGLPGAAWVMAQLWREWCTDRGHIGQEGGMRCYPSHFLILSPRGLSEICRDGGLLRHPPETKAAAIGIGAPVCMGAVHLAESCCVFKDHEIAERAIMAAIDLCDGCMGPVQVEVLEVPEVPEPPKLGCEHLLLLISNNNINMAIKYCNSFGSPLSIACKMMLLQANQGELAIQAAFAERAEAVGSAGSVPLVTVRDALLERAR